MHPAVLIALSLLLILPGCLGSDPDEPPGDGVPDEPDEQPEQANGTGPPELVPGMAWTYTSSGVYNTGGEVTIVVARADEDGYLLAGQDPADLVEQIVWGNPILGPLDRELNPIPSEEGGTWMAFDWPLVDGKTWTDEEGRTHTVEARTLETPAGSTDGFLLTRTSEGGSNVTWTYAPSIGYLTSFELESRGVVWERFDLVGMGSAGSWTWFERFERFEAGGDQATAEPFEVPGERDALVVSAGGRDSARVVLTPPPGSGGEAWNYQAPEDQAWTYGVLDAHPGTWLAGTAAPEDGFGWFAAEAVTWITGSTT